jgi:hypothetical protein
VQASSSEYIVKVPAGIANVLLCQRKLVNTYETNRTVRTFETFFLLKSLTTSGVIQQYTKQLPWLLLYTKLSRGSFFSRIRQMEDLRLIERKDGNLCMASYAFVSEEWGCEKSVFHYLKYNIDDQAKLLHFIAAVEIGENKTYQHGAFRRKLDKNPVAKHVIQTEVLRSGADFTRLSDTEYFRQEVVSITVAAFMAGSEILDFLQHHWADDNRRCRTMQRQMNYRSASSVSYWKRCLRAAGVIAYRERAFTSKVRTHWKKPSWGDEYPHLRYLKGPKKTIWWLPDEIIINDAKIMMYAEIQPVRKRFKSAA